LPKHSGEVRLYRSQRVTNKPRTTGPQTAVVVGPPGEEIYTDKYGRVKVQFHWDRYGKMDENSSCWIRVSSNWAGANYGGIFIPRIGQEVIIDFINGDPDYPIITGRVYNDIQMPPWQLPDNKTQSGIKTRSSKDGTPGTGEKATPGTTNVIRFEDKIGNEQLWFHAQKDQLTEVENDEDKWVGNDRRKTIDRDEFNTIHRDRTEIVDRNEKINVHGWRTEEVDLDETITIHQNQKHTVDINRTRKVGNNESVTIGVNRTKKVGSNESDTIGSNWSIKVGSTETKTIGLLNMQNVGLAKMTNVGLAYSENVGVVMNTLVGIMKFEQVGINKSVMVGQNYSDTIGGDRTTEISGSENRTISQSKTETVGTVNVIKTGNHLELECAGAKIVLTGGGIYLQGNFIQVLGGSVINADAGTINLNCGAATAAPPAPPAPPGGGGGGAPGAPGAPGGAPGAPDSPSTPTYGTPGWAG